MAQQSFVVHWDGTKTCGAHTITAHGFVWQLEDAGTMCVKSTTGTDMPFWLEEQGWTVFHDNGTESDYGDGGTKGEAYHCVDGFIILPTSAQAEVIIEKLRALDGVEY